ATLEDLDLLVRHRRGMWNAIAEIPKADLDAADRIYRRWARTQMKSNRFAGFIVDVGGEPVASDCLWLMHVQPRPNWKGTTSTYEARTRRVFPMTTAYDVPPLLRIERIKEKLQAEGKIKPPEWAAFARTGVNTEKAPVQKDWWYRRVAAVLRKVYLHGPVG